MPLSLLPVALQAAGAAVQPTTPTASDPFTAADFLMAGGWSLVIVALAAAAAIAATVTARRTVRDAAADGDEVVRTVSSFIRSGNLVGAIDFCRSQDTVAARVVSEGLQRIGRPIEDIQTAVAGAARRETVRVTGSLETVRSAALVAALAGILGSATGLIGLLRATGPAVPDGLWPALVPAAVGAAVGLLLVGLFHAVAGRAADAAAGLDTLTGDFLNMLRSPG
ncbi:MAG TPA: MotA/TolQ/ExbB proton channel family protein [Rubricoccaceae bacterium]|jgi:biopolymer transport protein ExbB